MAAKRSNGEGSIIQLTSGNWRAQIMSGYTDDGKRKIHYFSGKTKKEVIAKVREFNNKVAQGLDMNQDYTFAEWADEWYESYRAQVKPSTYCGYKYTMKILKKHMGRSNLKDILPMHIGKVLAKIASEGYSKSQITKCRAMLIQIFDAAEHNMLTMHNPARKAKPLKTIDNYGFTAKAEREAFSPEEINLLFDQLPCDLIGHSIRLLILTGLRIQELLILSKDDITPDGSVIDINKAVMTVDGKAMLGPPKSKRSVRKVPVPLEGREYAMFLRNNSRGTFIWSSSIQKPIYSISSFRKKYNKAIKSIPGVRQLSPHCCRHTYITTLQSKGIPMETIARLVGHSRITTTDDYLHVSLDSLSDAVKDLSLSGN
jgi:integrase